MHPEPSHIIRAHIIQHMSEKKERKKHQTFQKQISSFVNVISKEDKKAEEEKIV